MSDSFLRERERLIAEVAENLGKVITSVNQLNRNIESVAVVGEGMTPVRNLWKQFEDVMATTTSSSSTNGTAVGAKATASPPSEPKEIFLHKTLPAGTDETAVLPAGFAPGGGDTVKLGYESSP